MCWLKIQSKYNYVSIYIVYHLFPSVSWGGWSKSQAQPTLCKHWAGNQTITSASSPSVNHIKLKHPETTHTVTLENLQIFLICCCKPGRIITTHVHLLACLCLHPVCGYLLRKFSSLQLTGSLCAQVLGNIMGADPTCLGWSRTTGRTMWGEWVWDWVVNTGQQLQSEVTSTDTDGQTTMERQK